MHAPYSHQSSTPMQRGYSDPRHSPPPSQQQQNWHHHDNNPSRNDSYAPYNHHPHAPIPVQRESEFTSFAKRRKTTSALSAPPLHRPHLPPQANSANSPYHRPSPYPYPCPSPSNNGATPLSACSTDSDSWQWSFFPDQRCEDRGNGASRLNMKSSNNDLNASASRTTKQPSRHQRKRSAGCLNCHTIWSPTWRKDAQGLMRCNACGLYLAARGQERPVTLMPKRKSNDEQDNYAKHSQPSTPREDGRYYPARNNSEDDCPPSPYFPNNRPISVMRPSPSFSMQTLETSSGASSNNSLPISESRDLLSPINTTGYSSSPLASPMGFSTLTLEPSRRLAYPGENTLGLKNLSRPSSAEYNLSPPEVGDTSVRVNTLPSPISPYFDGAVVDSRSPSLPPTKVLSRNESGNSSPRMMLPPLSELTRGLSSLRSDFRSGRHYSISQDRKQTELFALKC